MIYNLYVWTKKGKCIYYKAWHRQTSPKDSIEQEQSLMYGFLLALKSFVEKTSPSSTDTFNSYSTNTYKLHYFESASGLKFVITTDPKVPSLQLFLAKLYSDVYVEYAIKNPFYKLGDYISCTSFVSALEASITGHTAFAS